MDGKRDGGRGEGDKKECKKIKGRREGKEKREKRRETRERIMGKKEGMGVNISNACEHIIGLQDIGRKECCPYRSMC